MRGAAHRFNLEATLMVLPDDSPHSNQGGGGGEQSPSLQEQPSDRQVAEAGSDEKRGDAAVVAAGHKTTETPENE